MTTLNNLPTIGVAYYEFALGEYEPQANALIFRIEIIYFGKAKNENTRTG